jgi:hypothetical protein
VVLADVKLPHRITFPFVTDYRNSEGGF